MLREYQPPSTEMLRWVARHVHRRARVTAVAVMRGGLTAAMDRITVESPAAADYLAMYERVAGVRVDRRADLRALLGFDLDWQQFIPLQVAGRARLDVAGMPARVAAAVRDAVDAMG